jgi:hypothetical protein
MKHLVFLLFIAGLIHGEDPSLEIKKRTKGLPDRHSAEVKPVFQTFKLPDALLLDKIEEDHICYDSLRFSSLRENYKKIVLLYKFEENMIVQLIREVDWIASTSIRTFVVYVKEKEADAIIQSLGKHGFHMKTEQNWFERLFNFDYKYAVLSKNKLKVIYSKDVQSWISRECTNNLVDEDHRGFMFTIRY